MILSDNTILDRVSGGDLKIHNALYGALQPASIDLNLGTSWYRVVKNEPEANPVSLQQAAQKLSFVEAPAVIIGPGEFMLATTAEAVTIPDDVAGFITGRSSVGRSGLFTENAGFIDPGFYGQLTLELYNASPNPILLESGTRVAQLIFMQTDKPVRSPYNGKYNGQEGATPSRMYDDIVAVELKTDADASEPEAAGLNINIQELADILSGALDAAVDALLKASDEIDERLYGRSE